MSFAVSRLPQRYWLLVALMGLSVSGGWFTARTVLAQDRNWAATRLEDVDEDFAYQGEYAGERELQSGLAEHWGLQVVALGDGQFSGLAYPGGLPGAGWLGQPPRALNGTREGELLRLNSAEQAAGESEQGLPVCTEYFELDGSSTYMYDCTGELLATLDSVQRESPTLGAAPPEGATVLVGEGVDLEAVWDSPRVTAEGFLREGVRSQAAFGDCHLHLEYQMPYMPYARGQNRGNSGVYVQCRYEVQLLDSFGLLPGKWDCAALYSYEAPAVNMCLPPLAWQTLDIEFTAARFYTNGAKISPAVFTVRHNGELVHESAEMPGKTGYGENEGPEPGLLRLQDHGCPLKFRNIWLLVRQGPVEPAWVEDPLEELFRQPDPLLELPGPEDEPEEF